MSNQKKRLVNHCRVFTTWLLLESVVACEPDVFVRISNGILMYMYKIDVGRIIVNSQTVEY